MDFRAAAHRLLAELRTAREAAGLSQRALGRAMQVDQAAVSAHETGRTLPGLYILIKWADALGLDVVLAPRSDRNG